MTKGDDVYDEPAFTPPKVERDGDGAGNATGPASNSMRF